MVKMLDLLNICFLNPYLKWQHFWYHLEGFSAHQLTLFMASYNLRVTTLQALEPNGSLVEFTMEFVTFHGVPKRTLWGAIFGAARHQPYPQHNV